MSTLKELRAESAKLERELIHRASWFVTNHVPYADQRLMDILYRVLFAKQDKSYGELIFRKYDEFKALEKEANDIEDKIKELIGA